jgi:site-specific DNA-methyltransferase (adenine-specific)
MKTFKIHNGDCLKVLKDYPDNYFDCVITDPPYHLTSIVNRYKNTSLNDDNKTGKRAKNKSDGYARFSKGFMGKSWDGGDIAFRIKTWRKIFKKMKPGAYLAAFGGTRTYHRMTVAIEDAGFEIRDSIMYLYGSGMPKSQNVSKFIDKKLGKKRKVIGKVKISGYAPLNVKYGAQNRNVFEFDKVDDKPISKEAKKYNNFGTGLKPAFEPIVLARKPFNTTVADNVLKYGTGAMNIDACRIPLGDKIKSNKPIKTHKSGLPILESAGRWPANVIHDGSSVILKEFAKSGIKKTNYAGKTKISKSVALGDLGPENKITLYNDQGTVARYFYSAKANKHDRQGSKHPTIKPINLITYLVKLLNPPGGIVCDPFAGSGTLLPAIYRANKELNTKMKGVLIEKELEYYKDIKRRRKLIKQSKNKGT